MYDVISGISVGSINSAGIALYPKGQEEEATEFMVEMWQNMEAKNLWKYWDKGWYDAFTNETGILDSSPLKEFIESVLGNKSFYRKLIVGAVDLQTGSFLNIDADDLEMEERATAILASASVPGVFPITQLRNYSLVDGSTAWNLNLIGAIQKCYELGV